MRIGIELEQLVVGETKNESLNLCVFISPFLKVYFT